MDDAFCRGGALLRPCFRPNQQQRAEQSPAPTSYPQESNIHQNFQLHLLLMAIILRQLVANLIPHVSGGAYQDARKVTLVWNDRPKHWDLPEFRGRKHQTRPPKAPFSPPSFPSHGERWGCWRRQQSQICNNLSVSAAPSQHPYPFCPFGTFPPDRGNRPLEGEPGSAHRQRCQGNGRQPLSQPAADSSPGRGAKNRRCGAAAGRGHCSALAFTNP